MVGDLRGAFRFARLHRTSGSCSPGGWEGEDQPPPGGAEDRNAEGWERSLARLPWLRAAATPDLAWGQSAERGNDVEKEDPRQTGAPPWVTRLSTSRSA